MVRGLVVLIVGSIITYISYSTASAGGSYIICTGAVIIGALCFLDGLMAYLWS